jgi:predicted acetyltransferase
MEICLKELRAGDGTDIYEMLREIGPGENGFMNEGYLPPDKFKRFLKWYVDASNGVGLTGDMVPTTMYWLYIAGTPVGYAKLRHRLNDHLRKIGGHIGYVIRPSERGKGYGKLILKEMLVKAKALGLEEVLMTCMQENAASRKVIEANAGILSQIEDGECYYWIKI